MLYSLPFPTSPHFKYTKCQGSPDSTSQARNKKTGLRISVNICILPKFQVNPLVQSVYGVNPNIHKMTDYIKIFWDMIFRE